MEKYLISAIAVAAIGSTCNAADDLSAMFSQGKASGEIREFTIGRDVKYSDSSKDYFRSANAIGGHLKFETDDWNGLSFGTALYTTNAFLMHEKEDPTLLGPDNESYSILGEAYVQYKRGNTIFKGGRQKLDTPLAGSDDARMLPNLFEAYLLINSDIPGTTLIAGHVTRFAQGTFGRAYGAGGLLGATSGYSAVDASNQVGDFVNMGTYSVGTHTDGVSVVSATYTGIENLKVQLWDYYAYDILNAIYGEANFSWTCLLSDSVKPFVGVQVIKEDSVGDELVGNLGGDGKVDSLYWAGKFGFNVENFSLFGAYSQSTANDNGEPVYSSATISPWGGMPAYTQGMVTRHMFLAGTSAIKVAASYNWKRFGPDLKTVGYWANFAMDDNNGYTYDDASETGFDIIYKPQFVANLQLRLRGNFTDDFNVNNSGDTVEWNEYRFIVNYNF